MNGYPPKRRLLVHQVYQKNTTKNKMSESIPNINTLLT